MTARAHVIIRGEVQGVGFRNWIHRLAEGMMMSGFVRNRRDGTVEAVFIGQADDVEAIIDLCREGSPGASVSEVDRLPDGLAIEGWLADETVPFEITNTV